MTTLICDLESFKKFLEEFIFPELEKDKLALVALDKVGSWYAPSQRRNYYQICFALAADKLKENRLKHFVLGEDKVFAVAIVPKEAVDGKKEEEKR